MRTLIIFFSSYKATWSGLIIVLMFALLDFTPYSVPNSPAILTTVIVYVAFQNGLIPALLFGLVVWTYTALHFSLPGHFFHYDKPNLIRVITFAFMFPANAFMVGLLKEKLMDKIRDEKLIKDQALSSAKLSSLGEMAGGVAHEINNPLAIISVKCQQLTRLAKTDMIPKEIVLKSIEEINQTTERMSKIVKGLKLFARETSQDKMEMASVNDIIDLTLSFCQAKFDHHNVKLRYDYEKKSQLFLECRPTELSQILLNLLNNAYDAVENKEEKWIEIATSEDTSLIRISITDSGDGIPENIRSKVMDPFFTTKEPGKGTGLGLSISHELAKAHGGRLYIDEKCKNTRFVLELPKRYPNLNKVIG